MYDQPALGMRRKTGSRISSSTIFSYFKPFLDVCVLYFNAHPVKLGGPGKVVEFDETALLPRKNERGLFRISSVLQALKEGAISSFLLQLSTEVLLSLCRLSGSIPSTTIMLGKWAAYNGIQDLSERYQHLTVNHKLHFTDSFSGSCTSTIKFLWQNFIKGIRNGAESCKTFWTAISYSLCGRSCLRRTSLPSVVPNFWVLSCLSSSSKSIGSEELLGLPMHFLLQSSF